jgi:hopene-associated glycosyltransferase HpnB
MSAAKALGLDHKLSIVTGAAPPVGWTGKLWSHHQGIALADRLPAPPRYLLLTDADIVHAPDTVLWLVAHAEAGGYALSSLMARLRCESIAERLTIPAFIFFFQMLYPFSWVNDASRRTAAAAGGCMLVRRDALGAAGGITAIHDELIDDCALAKRIKVIGNIWIGLTERVQSIRAYPRFSDIGRMVSRSAYAQLGYSPLLLLATLAGLALIFLAPVASTIVGDGFDRILGAASWTLMAILFQPTLRFYRLSPLYGLVLPMTALIYMVFTCASAFQYAIGRGGMWKGRAQANVAKLP